MAGRNPCVAPLCTSSHIHAYSAATGYEQPFWPDALPVLVWLFCAAFQVRIGAFTHFTARSQTDSDVSAGLSRLSKRSQEQYEARTTQKFIQVWQPHCRAILPRWNVCPACSFCRCYFPPSAGDSIGALLSCAQYGELISFTYCFQCLAVGFAYQVNGIYKTLAVA